MRPLGARSDHSIPIALFWEDGHDKGRDCGDRFSGVYGIWSPAYTVQPGSVDKVDILRSGMQLGHATAVFGVPATTFVVHGRIVQRVQARSPGGGVALLRAKAAIGKLSDENADIQAGIKHRAQGA